MAEGKHSPRERFMLYQMGWRRGAGMKAIPQNVREDSDFNEGYADGRKAAGLAMETARQRLGCPPASILRTCEGDHPEYHDEVRYAQQADRAFRESS